MSFHITRTLYLPSDITHEDAKRFMDNITLDPNWYVHGVELGNEIVSGAGKIKISKLNINLNGRDVQGKPFWWQTFFR